VYPRRSGTVLTAILALALALAPAPAAMAAPPRTVDRSTLTPPLNPDFTWTCFDTGAGPICQGTYDDAWQDEDIGWDCDGQPIYTSGSGVERMTRWHLPDGRATKTVVNLRYRETLSLSTSGGGPVVHLRAAWNRHYDYLVPGDRSTRVLTEPGAWWLVAGHRTRSRDRLPGHRADPLAAGCRVRGARRAPRTTRLAHRRGGCVGSGLCRPDQLMTAPEPRRDPRRRERPARGAERAVLVKRAGRDSNPRPPDP
jgi:hypothetical protein